MTTPREEIRPKLFSDLAFLQNRYDLEDLRLLGTLLLIAKPEEDDVEAHMIGSYDPMEMARLYQKDLLRAVEETRILREIPKQNRGFFDQVSVSVGKFFVATGRRMMGVPVQAGAD